MTTNHDIDFPTSREWGNWYDGAIGYQKTPLSPLNELPFVLITAVEIRPDIAAVTFRLSVEDANTRRIECKDAMRKRVENIIACAVATPTSEVEFWQGEPTDGYLLVQARCGIVYLERL